MTSRLNDRVAAPRRRDRQPPRVSSWHATNDGLQAIPSKAGRVVLRFNRRLPEAISHGFARLTQHALDTPPTTNRGMGRSVTACALRSGR
jgi:hypothetical protein